MPRKSFYFLWGAIPILTTINQACIKLLAAHMRQTPFGWSWLTQAASTPWMAVILLCEGLGFTLWMAILADTGVSKALPISAIAYILILLMSWIAFKEPVMPLQLLGSALILVGAWLIGSASVESPPR